jgi:trk system potassium uptake protein TrkH
MNIGSIFNLFSKLVAFFAISMLIPAIYSFITKDGFFISFLLSFCMIIAPSILIWAATKKYKEDLQAKDGFFVITFFWLILASVGSIPFLLFGIAPIDSFFESMSGITTTGATVITGLDELPKSLLLYRQLLQWLGGMGLIVLAIAIMPLLGIGGGQIFKTDVPGAMNDQKLTPRIKETAQSLWLIYVILTILCAIFYFLNGMGSFDAISHALSTVSIGGFSTHDESIGYFNSFGIELVCIIFMLLSALSFALHYNAYTNFSIKKYFYDPESGFFIGMLFFIFIIILISSMFYDFGSVTSILFQTVSIVTTTGFTNDDYSSWPLFASFLLLMGAFVGACSGSVGGGIKSWRFMIMINHSIINLKKMIHPHGVFTLKLGPNKVVENDVAASVWGFFSIYVISFMILLVLMLFTGMDFLSAFSAIGACLNNLGPGLGMVADSYSGVSDFGKVILSFAMILGRLEIFTLLVILVPSFWSD